MDNRWIVTLNSDEAREYLLHHGLTLFNKKIKLRRYDDVLNDEGVPTASRSDAVQQEDQAATL